ncbi:hypothetical protein [Nakamurella lactea]|uniref:hypothetical protein n=1 Tax=Nakamurella lactea TaxID=459515 RepID=UPI0004019E25|nr:hypothetical protein [Nakamurella lactea]
MDLAELAGLPTDGDIEALVRRYEPVIRYTEGELFFPTDIGDYVERSALWLRRPGGEREMLVDHGDLSIDELCRRSRSVPVGTALELRYVPGPLSRADLRRWRRDPGRPRLRGSSRFAAVGLLGRIIDSLFRLSLIVRGSVPGGLTAAMHAAYRDSPSATKFSYYAHVSSAGGYLAIQYWFFYAMNDWRSTFAGVNDHEADWEQVTVYLAPDAGTDSADGWSAAWIAFSSHDETGDDLRRRHDDPDVSWVGRTHPVVNAGAGSHSGAYLAGEYLVTVEPPALRRTFAAAQRIRSTLFPWTAGRSRAGVGLPYIDYKRGDGAAIGPGTGRDWSPVLIDADTPWVRDFRGLWGLDTQDPFGGERAPAGPRYERTGSIRPSWSDPVAWAGLDKVPATEAARLQAVAAQLAAVRDREAALTNDITAGEVLSQQLAAAVAALPPNADAVAAGVGARGRLAEHDRLMAALRADRRAAVIEREHLQERQLHPLRAEPHDHLRHRRLPDVAPARPVGMALRFWTEASLAVLLAILGLMLIVGQSNAWIALFAATLAVCAVEALLRRRLALFLLGVAVLVIVVGTTVLLVRNLRAGLGVLALIAAAMVMVTNLRSYLARR